MGTYGERVLPHLTNVLMGSKELAEVRERVCADLAGDVLEIGFGTGHNLPHVPRAVTRLLAVEPSELSVRLARDRVAAAPFPVEVVGLDGQQIPLPDDSADAALCTWSLCTIPDPTAALHEVRRVLRPGGELHFVEHGAAPQAGVRRWQNRLNRLQNTWAGGCNLNRDIAELIRSAGFRVTRLDNSYLKGPKPFGYLYEGVATA
jgi:ubiquinone/menaquinone biosynthesis C-methylase UbiE